jgi:hypothetical protein
VIFVGTRVFFISVNACWCRMARMSWEKTARPRFIHHSVACVPLAQAAQSSILDFKSKRSAGSHLFERFYAASACLKNYSWTAVRVGIGFADAYLPAESQPVVFWRPRLYC